MTASTTIDGNTADTLLANYLSESDPREERRLLESLVTELRSIVTRVLTARFGRELRERERLEDACQDCLVSIIRKIGRLKTQPEESAVGSLSAYAVTTAQNAYRGEMRQQNPERYRLRQRIISAIHDHPAQLAAWNSGAKLICGLAEWIGSTPRTTPRYQEWLFDKSVCRAECLNERIPGEEISLDQALLQVFRWLGTPVEVNELVSQLAELLQMPDGSFAGLIELDREDPGYGNYLEQLPDVSENVEDFAVESVHRETLLRRAWSEILQLPLRQRTALLLSLPPEAFMAYRLLMGPEAICQCLELSRSDVDRLPSRLPIPDADLASEMGIKRQQVINLRLSARQRLARRIPASD